MDRLTELAWARGNAERALRRARDDVTRTEMEFMAADNAYRNYRNEHPDA